MPPRILAIALPFILITQTHAATVDPVAIVAAHNQYRTELSVPPLTWSDKLATDAQGWADELARSGSFHHSDTPDGENLWAGSSNYYSQTSMVGTWGDEKSQYINGTFPDVTKGGVVGHYTQIIWRNTTQVGCGLASGNGMDYFVCRYNPAGNFIGEKPY